jgi:uncharacterized membrane protein YsdA (DUF1294 family)
MTAVSSESSNGRTCMSNSREWALHRTVAGVPPPSRPAKRRFDPLSLAVLAAFALGWLAAALARGVPAWAALLYAGASALCFVFYAIDKAAARAGRERIPESMLLSLGFVGGWPGAIVAQQMFRHKTTKRMFRARFWVSVAANVAIFAWATLVMVRPTP